MAVSGRAAASAKPRLCGIGPTMRSSTACSSALLPWRVRSPAYQTRSPGLKSVTSAPTASTVPAASQPSTFSSPGGGAALRRTLVSTGLTDTACTRTSRSRGPGFGSGRVTSSSDSASSIGSDWR